MGLDFWGCPQRPRRSSPSPIRTRPGPWAPWELLSPSMVAGGNSLRVRSSNEDWGCRLFKVVLATGGISSSPNNPKSIVWEHPKKSNPYFIKIPLGKQGEVEENYWKIRRTCFQNILYEGGTQYEKDVKGQLQTTCPGQGAAESLMIKSLLLNTTNSLVRSFSASQLNKFGRLFSETKITVLYSHFRNSAVGYGGTYGLFLRQWPCFRKSKT